MREQYILDMISRLKKAQSRTERLFVRVTFFDGQKVSSIEYGDGSSNGDKNELVQRLFDLSLHCEIYKTEPMYWATDSCGEPCLFGLLVRVRECKGATNITPDVIEAVADILSPYQTPRMTTWAWGYSCST